MLKQETRALEIEKCTRNIEICHLEGQENSGIVYITPKNNCRLILGHSEQDHCLGTKVPSIRSVYQENAERWHTILKKKDLKKKWRITHNLVKTEGYSEHQGLTLKKTIPLQANWAVCFFSPCPSSPWRNLSFWVPEWVAVLVSTAEVILAASQQQLCRP